MKAAVEVAVNELELGKERSLGGFKYQADIVGAGFDHHGRGNTPSEALLMAAAHWHAWGNG